MATPTKRRRLTAPTLRSAPPERPELVADEVERRDEGNRDRRGGELPDAGDMHEEIEKDESRTERGKRDDDEAHPLDADVAAMLPERPMTVPRVVARHGDAERNRLRE